MWGRTAVVHGNNRDVMRENEIIQDNVASKESLCLYSPMNLFAQLKDVFVLWHSRMAV